MTINNPGPLPAADGLPDLQQRMKTPEEAARQFEKVLARQFVGTMTRNLFKAHLAGERGPAWMEGYRDTQRDMLTHALTEHLVESGSLGLSALLLRQWNQPEKPSDE